MFLLFISKKNKVIFTFGLIVFLLIGALFLVYEQYFKPNPTYEVSGMVVDISSTEKYQKITIKNKFRFYIIYDDQNTSIKIGDFIVGSGEPSEVTHERIPHGFDYADYLKRQKVVGILFANEIVVIGHFFHLNLIKQKIKEQVTNKFDDISAGFLLAVILGDSKGLANETKESIKDNGILHLFAISGLHIGLFIGMLGSLLQYIKVGEKAQNMIIFGFLLLYLIVTNFTPSIFRASLMWGFMIVNKKWNLKLSSLDGLCICFLGLLIMNPYYMFQLGFQLSFLATFVIVVCGPLVQKQHIFVRIFLLSLLCLLFALPLIINMNYEINVLSPFTNVLFILLFESVILPVSIVVMFTPWLGFLYQYFIIAFFEMNEFFSNHFALFLRLPHFSMIDTLLFYVGLVSLVFVFFAFSGKKVLSITLMLLMVIIFRYSNTVMPLEIVFLDLEEGESTVILAPQKQCYAVIDTGTGMQEEVTTFLKSKGVTAIDFLIISHNHHDHNGETITILENFVVKNTVVSVFDQSNIAKIAQKKVKTNDEITCGKIVFQVLSPGKFYDNINNQSIVLRAHINELMFLWMGDVEKEV
ncbi:MAG: ComEC/Rec2 family competence protein, partial [Bacilli bacterium]|nr:ComEC/Rec2 family competence protein [Bacilli bacterium]